MKKIIGVILFLLIISLGEARGYFNGIYACSYIMSDSIESKYSIISALINVLRTKDIIGIFKFFVLSPIRLIIEMIIISGFFLHIFKLTKESYKENKKLILATLIFIITVNIFYEIIKSTVFKDIWNLDLLIIVSIIVLKCLLNIAILYCLVRTISENQLNLKTFQFKIIVCSAIIIMIEIVILNYIGCYIPKATIIAISYSDIYFNTFELKLDEKIHASTGDAKRITGKSSYTLKDINPFFITLEKSSGDKNIFFWNTCYKYELSRLVVCLCDEPGYEYIIIFEK